MSDAWDGVIVGGRNASVLTIENAKRARRQLPHIVFEEFVNIAINLPVTIRTASTHLVGVYRLGHDNLEVMMHLTKLVFGQQGLVWEYFGRLWVSTPLDFR